MEEDEIVISSWQRDDFPKDSNEIIERRPLRDRASKEHVDLNAWLAVEESKDLRVASHDSEDDEIILDDDVMSRLIEGDHTDSNSLVMPSSIKPKPKPRHKEVSSDDRKSSADQLFAGKKEKLNKDHNETSPRPVPRPRSKPVSRETSVRSPGHRKDKSLDESGNSSKLRADKLFDSIGKGNKSVSFGDMSEKQDSFLKDSSKFGEPVEKGDINSGKKTPNEGGTRNKKTPPTKPARTKNKPGGSKKGRSSEGDESDNDDSRAKSHIPEHKRPPQRQPRQNLEKNKMPDSDHKGRLKQNNYDEGSHNGHIPNSPKSNRDSNGFNTINDDSRENFLHGHQDYSRQTDIVGGGPENFNAAASRRDRSEKMEHSFRNGNISEPRILRGQNVPREQYGEQVFDRSDDGRFMNSRDGRFMNSRDARNYDHRNLENSQRGFMKHQDRNQMFEEHVPNIEGVLHEKGEKNRKDEGRFEGKPRRNTPMKAERGLEEMTKSPESYKFEYESRDTPHRAGFSGGLSSKRSSSLTNLSSWGNTQFEDDDGLESWRSEFTSSTSIREAVYNEWLEKKQKGMKVKSKKKVEEKKKEEEKLKENLQEKQISAKKAFEAWSSSKEGVIKDQVKKKKEIQDKEIEVKREKITKQKDAKKFFESWKSKKDEILKESFKENKTKEKEEKQKEVEDKKEKIDIAKKSYNKWKARKDEQLKDDTRSKRRGEIIKKEYEKEAEMEKREECEKTYQEFLKKKGTWKRPPPSPTLTQRAWCPGGLTRSTNLIPDKVQPVILTPTMNRSRSFSGTTRATSFHGTSSSGKGRW